MSAKKCVSLLIFLFLVTVTSVPPALSKHVEEPYPQPEKVIVLMPTPSKYVDPYIERFKEWYFEGTGKKIEVEHIQVGGVKLVSRVEEQKGEPYEDVVMSLRYEAFEQLKRKDYLQPYVSPNVEFIPEKVLGALVGKDSGGYYTGFSLAAYGIMVNNEVLQDEGLPTPTGYANLSLTKDYRGFIVMGSPTTTEIAHGNIDVILSHYGWLQGWNVSIHLASLIDQFTVTTGKASSLTVEGKYAAVLTKNTYYNEYVEEGYPVEWIWPEEGTLIYILYIGMLEGARHPENAKYWIDWVLSEEGQQAWIQCRHETVIRSNIELPPGIPSIEELSAVAKVEPNYDEAIVEKRYDLITALWAEKITGYHPMLQKNYDNPEIMAGVLNDWIIEPMHESEVAIAEAHDVIAEANALSLTERGQSLIEQAETQVTEAQSLHDDFKHEEARVAAEEALTLALSAKSYVVQPPVWPYYLGMIIIGTVATIATFGYFSFRKKYEELKVTINKREVSSALEKLEEGEFFKSLLKQLEREK